jgi:phospholipid/cholesterol/gamma-HCH transport system ATP-binding protein
MAMFDKGRMLIVESREWFDALRKTGEEQASTLSEDHRLIRQFLRGDAQGPLTARKQASNAYERALLGEMTMSPVPSIEPTRRR